MEKKICAYLLGLTFITLSSVVHGQGEKSPTPEPTTPVVATASRSPSVEPISEIDIEAPKGSPKQTGYNFVVAEEKTVKARVPANILTKAPGENETSYTGPIIFLIALPIGLWIVVSRKFTTPVEDKRVDYYPKTQQFKPHTNEFQKTTDDDEDDVDFPKAS
ncbi:MAG: hypothetical protein K2Q18_19765 [Bdellovibrionales bacterium]|nr:hypothetical protein [Bdellovibrionales bacterium]